MTAYETLRHFADSWGLLAMMVVFLVLCAWPFRPGSNARNRAAANLIFKDSDDGE